MNELNCPARTYGRVAVCHFCIYTAGGPSALCVRMAERHHQELSTKAIPLPVPLPVTSELVDLPPVSE